MASEFSTKKLFPNFFSFSGFILIYEKLAVRQWLLFI